MILATALLKVEHVKKPLLDQRLQQVHLVLTARGHETLTILQGCLYSLLLVQALLHGSLPQLHPLLKLLESRVSSLVESSSEEDVALLDLGSRLLLTLEKQCE